MTTERQVDDQSQICIYCSRLLPVSQFNREHVLPQLLGRFQDNLVLRSVCMDCNSSLGKHLETWLGRESYEALLRLRFGQKPLSEIGEFRGKGMVIRLPPGSEWSGALLRLVADQDAGELRLDLVAQVGVKRPTDQEFRFFTREEYLRAPHEQIGEEPGSSFKIIGPGNAGYEEMIGLVRERIPRLKIHGTLPDPPAAIGEEIAVSITSTVNRLLTRSIAKIAFNYLAYITQDEFVLSSAFDDIREFIRYGEGDWRGFVRPRERPILANDQIWYGVNRAHLVTVDWRAREDTITSSVSIFNETMYDILLAKRCPPIWQAVRSGHAFFWESGEIKELISTNLYLPFQMARI